MPLSLGDRVPEVPLVAPNGDAVSLGAFRGRPVILALLRYFG